MNYREFERLFDGDRIVFMMGMELFLENGRMALLEHSEEELGQAVGEKLTGFFAQEKVNAVVQAAKAFAQLKTTEQPRSPFPARKSQSAFLPLPAPVLPRNAPEWPCGHSPGTAPCPS